MDLSVGAHNALLFREALYQGTASAVPGDREKGPGFSPCGHSKASVAKAFGYMCVAPRLKPCPDTKPATRFPHSCGTPPGPPVRFMLALVCTLVLAFASAGELVNQVEARDVDHRADIYSMGLIIYEMFTADIPFRGESAMQLMYQRVTAAPQDPRTIFPEMPDYLANIILKCLERDPAKRYQSAREVLDDLDAQNIPALSPSATTTTPAPAPKPKPGSATISIEIPKPRS